MSAALVLGRCRRRVLVLDERRPRNVRSHAVHNLLTREGTPPDVLLRLGRREVRRFGVEVRTLRVTDAERTRVGFVVRAAGRRLHARKLLLATGIRDNHPTIEGFERFVGRGVAYCTNGTPRPRGAACDRLGRHGIPVRRTRIVRLEGDHRLRALVLRGGARLPCEGLYSMNGRGA